MDGDGEMTRPTSHPDPADLWGDAQARVCALVLGVDGEATRRRVPATPDWTVRDLLSHMVGVGVDVVAGREDPDHSEEWTAAHIASRADQDVIELVAEWRGVAEALQAHMREHGGRPLADLMIHEQGLRGAVGVHGAQDDPGHAWVSRRMLSRVPDALGDGQTLALVSPSGSWTSHGGDPGTADVEVRTSDFDLARALTSRRTEAQLRGWTTRGDLDAVRAAFTLVGPLPEQELPC